MSAVDAAGISVCLAESPILTDVSFTINWGELVVIVGPNGAGKSTLLGAIAGDVAISSGTISIDSLPLSEYSSKELARTRSVQTQENVVAFPFTVHDIVAMGRSPWTGSKAVDDEDVIASALDAVDMARFAGRRYTSLSGGERARATLGRVLAQQARIVLLDEPTAALDLNHQEAVLGIAQGLCREGRAVVAVLHDLSLAAAYADRVLILQDGRIFADGSPEEVFVAEKLTEVYGIPIDVIRHPRTGAILVQPRRG